MDKNTHTKGMLKEESFRDRTIIITGGATGLGKSMATYLSRLGANIVICSRKEDNLLKSAEYIMEETGNTVLPVVCDVRDTVQIQNVIDESIKKFNGIDCLVNNAAGNFISPTERLSPKGFDVIIDIVLKGTSNFTLILGKEWIKNKVQGNILNIVTTYSFTGSGYVAPSAAAKGGVLALTKSIAAEWAKFGIRANAIAPGPFPTDGAWERLFPKVLAKFIKDPKKRVPLNRFGEHQELSNLAAYLLSDYSSYITGEVITIDGGEWTYNAGQFNWLDKVPSKLWPLIEKATRKR